MYNDSDQLVPYEGIAKIPAEIQDIRDELFFGRTIREIISIAIAVAVTGGLSLFMLRVLHITNVWCIVFAVGVGCVPFVFGFVKPSGLNLEDYFLIWYSQNIKSASTRKLSGQNEYEKMRELALQHEKSDKAKKKKPRKTKSVYVVKF